MADLARNVAVAAGLAVGDGQESLPDPDLKGRAGEGERDIEILALPLEILGQLPLGRTKQAVVRIFGENAKANSTRVVVLSQDGGQAGVVPHQLERADRRADPFENQIHHWNSRLPDIRMRSLREAVRIIQRLRDQDGRGRWSHLRRPPFGRPA